MITAEFTELERQALWDACKEARAKALAADAQAVRCDRLADEAARQVHALRAAAEAARTAAREAHAACEALGTHAAMPAHF